MAFLIVFICTLGFTKSAGAQTPNALMHAVYQKTKQAQDYMVDAYIKSDIPLIKTLPVKAKIYFKQEDKITIKSKSIAVLPKQGLNSFAMTIKDTNSYTAIVTGKEKIGNSFTDVVSLIPNLSTGEMILAKLWVDKQKNLVLQSQLTTRTNGTMQINYFYKSQEKYGLPDSLVFTVDVKKFKIPKGLAADLNKRKEQAEESDKENKKGKVYVRLTNYQINTGLKDEIFKK